MTAEAWHDEYGESPARQRRRRRPYRDLRQELSETTDRQRQELGELRQQLKQLSELLNQVRQQRDVLAERLAPPAWTLRLETRLTSRFAAALLAAP